jgi:LacI family transcriptional regulator
MYATPPLSTIQQPAFDLGRLAAAAMLELLVGNTPTEQLPAPALLVRASSDSRRA